MGHGGGQTHYKPTTTICGIGGTLYGATDIEILEGEGEDFRGVREDFGGRGRILGEGGDFRGGRGRFLGGKGQISGGRGNILGKGGVRFQGRGGIVVVM